MSDRQNHLERDEIGGVNETGVELKNLRAADGCRHALNNMITQSVCSLPPPIEIRERYLWVSMSLVSLLVFRS